MASRSTKRTSKKPKAKPAKTRQRRKGPRPDAEDFPANPFKTEMGQRVMHQAQAEAGADRIFQDNDRFPILPNGTFVRPDKWRVPYVTRNEAIDAIATRVAELGCDPLKGLVHFANADAVALGYMLQGDYDQDPQTMYMRGAHWIGPKLRFHAYREIASYMFPKIKMVQLADEMGGPLGFLARMAPEQRAAKFIELMERVSAEAA